MWFIYILLIFVFLNNLSYTKCYENEPVELADVLADNLRVDPRLQASIGLTEDCKLFIDEIFDNFLSLATQNKHSSRLKRNLNQQKKYFDLDIYANISPRHTPTDIKVFALLNQTYIVTTENSENTQYLVIYQQSKNLTFVEFDKKTIFNSQNIALVLLETEAIIVASECYTNNLNNNEHLQVFVFNAEEKLKVKHKIKWAYASHVALWKNDAGIFMSLSQSEENSYNLQKYNAGVIIFKWQQTYFDIIQTIQVAKINAVTAFSIGSHDFIAVANGEIANPGHKVYSEIRKYSLQENMYLNFQYILSNNCNGIKYFEIADEDNDQHFLVLNYRHQYETEQKNSIFIYKYVGNYFIPFQNPKINADVKQIQPVSDTMGHALLLLTTSNGLQTLNYDGWHFHHEMPSEYDSSFESVTSVSVSQINDTKLIAVCGRNISSIYQLTFFEFNKRKQFYTEMMQWCRRNLEAITISDESDFIVSSRSDMKLEPEAEAQIELISDLDDTTLKSMEKKLNNSIYSKKGDITLQNVNASVVIIKSDCNAKSLNVPNINNDSINDIVRNSLNINEGFEVFDDTLNFEIITVEHSIAPKSLNGIELKKFWRKTDNINASQIIINGTATFEKELIVKDKVNSKHFNRSNVMLQSMNQTFTSLKTNKITVENIDTNSINSVSIDSLENSNALRSKISHLESLRTKNLTIQGLINGICCKTLNRYALRKNGDQNITGSYYFNDLSTDNIDISGLLSQTNTSTDLISLEDISNIIFDTVIFTNNLTVNNFTVRNSLNSIKVDTNGELEILLKDSETVQHITGLKEFNYVKIVHPEILAEKIISKQLKDIHPLTEIDEHLEIHTDVTIHGNASIGRIIKANDILTSNKKYSFVNIQKNALSLNETKIPIHLKFSNPIYSDILFADKINNIDPLTWVVNGVNQTQIIQARKQFKGDLEITGPTNVFKINNVNVPNLEQSVLKIQGDQHVGGRYEIKRATAMRGVQSNNTLLNGKNFNDTLKVSEDSFANETKIFNGNLNANKISVKSIQVDGLVNNFHFAEVANDAVRKDWDFKVFGDKKIEQLTIENLVVLENDNIKHYLNNVIENKLELLSDLNLINDISVKNIQFSKNFNNLTKLDIENIKYENETIIFKDDQLFEEITVYGNVFVETDKINNISLTRISNDTVKTDEPFEFNSTVNFRGGIIVNNTLNLIGNIEKLDIDNIFAQNENDIEFIAENKIINANLTIYGNLILEEYLSGVNYMQYCNILNHNKSDFKSLIIKGNTIFSKGPKVSKQFQENDIPLFENYVWFSDRKVNLSGDIYFQDVTFLDELFVDRFIDGVDLNLLYQNYFSKSKNQTINANIDFTSGVTFLQDVSVPEIKLDGSVNDISYRRLQEAVLLNDTNQIFEFRPYFETVYVHENNDKSDYLVNGLDLENDVMRYDKDNKITGKKTIKNIGIDILKVSENVKIGNINITDWLDNTVLTTGSFNIPAKKTFKTVQFGEGLSIKGTINKQPFTKDNVMIKNIPQRITGKKVFAPIHTVEFRKLYVTKYVNDVNITDFVKHQARSGSDIIFQSQMIFRNTIETEKLIVNKYINDVNVIDLIGNITKLNQLENFESIYNGLLDKSVKIRETVQNQAFYLQHYIELTQFVDTYKIFQMNTKNDSVRLIRFFYNDTSIYLQFLDWNDDHEDFEKRALVEVRFNSNIHYINQISYENYTDIYLEGEADPYKNEGYTHIALMLHVNDTSLSPDYKIIRSNGTKFSKAFRLEELQKDCFGLVTIDNAFITIFCDVKTNIYLVQSIQLEMVSMISFENINGSTYLIAAISATRSSEPGISIMKFTMENQQFKFLHHIFEGDDPVSLTTITYNGVTFLATSYRRLTTTMHLGRLSIRRFNKELEEFDFFQNINIHVPIYSEFSLLPSNELVLYVATEYLAEPLCVYQYQGISGFEKKFEGSTLERTYEINSFSSKYHHFVVANYGFDRISVIKAVFKGVKWRD